MLYPDSSLRPSRRQFLSGIVASGIIYPSANTFADDEVTTPSPKGGTFRVKAIVKSSGDVHLKSQISESTDEKGRTKPIKKAPFRVATTIDWEELSQFDPGLIDCMGYASIHEAETEVQVDRHITKTKLRENCREIVRLSKTSKRLVTNSLDNPLFAAEVSLIEIPVTSMFLDEIVTRQQVKITDKWSLSDAVTSRLLGLDSVDGGKIVACLIEADKESAKIELDGTINGTVASTATTIKVEGKAQLDRTAGVITWFAANIEETRNISERAPGFHVLSQVQIRRIKIDSLTNGETQETIVPRLPSLETAGLRQFQSDFGHFRFLANNRWITFRDSGEEAIYRFIVDDERIAQCNVVNMIDFEPGRQLSLDGFVSDIKAAITNSTIEIREASEQVTAAKMRSIRVIAQGTVQGVDVLWIHYHVSNDDGRRAMLTFMLNVEDYEKFGSEDAQIANAFELINWPKRFDNKAVEEASSKATDEQKKPTSQPAISTSSVPKVSR